MKSQIFVALLLSTSSIVFGQQHTGSHYQGYAQEVSGKRFTYHSPLSAECPALLSRGMEDYDPIVWKTAVVPKNHQGKFVTFLWAFGRDVDTNPATFHLSVNDKKWFSFKSPTTSDLGISKIQGPSGSELAFNVTMLDKYKDQMGFAVLKLPVDSVKLGESAQLKIEAEPANNNAWFMIFKEKVEEKVDIYQNKVVIKDTGKLFHSISVDFIHVGKDVDAKVSIGNITSTASLKAGLNKLEINLPKVDKPTNYTASIKVGDRSPVQKNFTLSPVKKWEIYLVQHTHTDIGYTRPQTEILPEHLKFIDHALDYCDMTDDFPDAAKFRWTCETSWSIREYLNRRPKKQVDRLLKRLQEGRIEATGMFFNFSEIIDESALAAQTKTLRMFKNMGIDVKTAMQNDVNGIAWCLVDYFAGTDVKYLTMGLHGHRARLPFNKPTAFWWQSPSGKRLLAYRSEHYQHGNILSLTTGQQDVLRTNLSKYLTGLEEKGYPYDKISLQFSGYITDNSPPSVKACKIIKEWNEKYEYPKLRSAIAKDFMLFLDETHADEIPTQEVAWPDWWTDGVASAANETKVARATHTEMAANTTLLSMAKMMGADLPEDLQKEITEVYDHLLFYDEHTHGAAESVTDPLAQNTINQWGMKAAHAWEGAVKSSMLQEKALAFITPHIEKSNLPIIAVFNTLNWERSGMVRVFIEYELLPQGSDFLITDNEGKEVPSQISESRQEGAYYELWIENMPPVGYKTLEIKVGHKPNKEKKYNPSGFENQFYKISFDGKKGILNQIFDKEIQKNILDPNAGFSLGQMIYEELGKRHALERLTAINRDTVYKPLDLKRTNLSAIQVKRTTSGAIYKSIFVHGKLPICADERGVDIEIRLYHFQKKIEFLYRMFKLPVTTPESVYVSFPFKLDNGELAFEVQGGVVYPGKNQLEGSSSDWNTIQNFAAVKSKDAQIVFGSKDMPLVQLGDINIGRYYYRLKPKTNHIYSWVLNNYWVTNFKASQQGELRWTYSITSSKDNSDMFATKFGWSDRVPILSRVILPKKGIQKSKSVSRSLINLNAPSVLLVNSTPSMDGTGIILHLREIEGGHATLDIRKLLKETGAKAALEVNILEETLGILNKPLLIEHFETKFIKLTF